MTDAGEDEIVLKLLHTADWHLGRRFKSFPDDMKLTRARLDALDKILLVAEHYMVHAVLCAGDLFDDPYPTPEWWQEVANRLKKRNWKDRPVFLLPGNHDPLLADSVWAEGHRFRSALPDWVHVVDREKFEFALPGNAVLHAVPCMSKAGARDPTESIPRREPGDDRIRIGMVHGSTFDAKDWQIHFPIAADAAILRGLDYLAIGDTHGFRFVPPDRMIPPTIYPGTPEQTAFDERDAGYVAVVLINRQRRASVQKERVAQWRWEEREIRQLGDLRELRDRPDLLQIVLRLRLDLRLPAPEYEEAVRLLDDLEGTEAKHGRVGVLDSRSSRTDARREHDRRVLHGVAGGPPVGGPQAQGSGDAAGSARHCRKGARAPLSALANGCPMRLTEILVEHFQALIRAEVAFGPGLNVIYGPNDLGKSTLAQAIRAALLVVPTSAASEPFEPWYADAVPRVTLSFEDDDGQFWRVKKGFETSAHAGSAELHHSKDGLTFTLEAKSRLVEERLRAILGWGIAAPGGKGSPRGMPESFLAHTLLAAQTDVDRILGQSLAEDATDTGKVRLSKALATLAQDPLFKKVLDAAQHEVDACFTARGQRKRGQGSRFTEALQAVKDLESQLATTRKLDEEASAGAARVVTLRVELTRRIEAVGEAQAVASQVRERLKRWQQREEANARLQASRQVLAQIDARASEVAAGAADVERLSVALRSADDALLRVTTECAAADAALRASEEAHRVATSEEGARQRGLRLALMKTEHAENRSKIQTAESQRARVEEALSAKRAAAESHRAILEARDDLAKAMRDDVTGHEVVVELEKHADFARTLGEYGHWKVAAQAVKDAAEALAIAKQSRSEADVRERDAETATASAARVESEIDVAAAKLTTFEHLKTLLQLEREVERTEAALGGGLTVVLRPRKAMAAHAVVDHAIALDEKALETERVLEAERSVHLTLGKLLEVDITAGAAEKRRELARLRSRWEAEAAPVLQASGFGTLSALEEALERVTADRQRIEALRRDAAALRAQANELRARAAVHDKQAAKLADATSHLEAREMAIRGCDRASLEQSYAKLGKGWESQVTALSAKADTALAEARTRAGTLKNACGVAEFRVKDADERAVKATEMAMALAAGLASADPGSLAGSLEQEIATLSLRQKGLADGLAALEVEATSDAQQAAEVLEKARARVALAKGSQASAVRHRDGLLADRSARTGHHDALKAQLDAMDRSGAAQKVKVCEDALKAFAGNVATSESDLQATESNLEGAKRALDEIRLDLHHAEGALSKVGGMAVAEEVVRLEEAVVRARARVEDLEVDADAHKLLLDTLREVENAEDAHLGRALSGPVAARFRELTDGRYGTLNLTPALTTQGVRPVGAGAREVLTALSVGTREQLATLIRLAIAQELKSAIVLDDQLVQSDPRRLSWFRDVLRRTCLHAQVIVLTCRPEDYLASDELPNETPVRDLAGGAIRAIDFARVAKRWTPAPSQSPTGGSERPRSRAPSTNQGAR